MTAPLLRARGLGIDVADTTLLDDVDLDVEAGELVAVVGPNGAGKSTLLHALAGDLTPTRGQVELSGRDLQSTSHADLARLRAVVGQDTAIAAPFRVADVVRMGQAPLAGGDDEAVARALEDTQALHLAGRTYPSLSGGERARVALARALVQQTPLLLLDEPTAALDLRHDEAVLGLLKRRTRAGQAVVVVLHDLDAAASWADRVVVVAGGRVAVDGVPTEVLTEDRLAAVYGHGVAVMPHPRTGRLLVVPDRGTTVGCSE